MSSGILFLKARSPGFQMIASRFASLAVFMTLAFVPLAGQVSAQSSALTPELLSKMLDLIARKGTDRDISPTLANALGLSAAGQGWPNRQIVTRETQSGFLHGMGISRGNDQDRCRPERGWNSVWRIPG
jgi:hypothetical protein